MSGTVHERFKPNAVLDVKRTDALWAVKLMGRNGHQVHTELVYARRDLAYGLCSIRM